MSMSTAETIGFSNQLVQFFQESKTDLKAKGLDVTDWITEIAALGKDAVAKDAEQDDLRAALRTKTAETQESVKTLYKTSSTRLDAAIGVLGKDTPVAKQAARLRSSLIKQSKNKTAEKVKI
jgi:hypothetical protein